MSYEHSTSRGAANRRANSGKQPPISTRLLNI